MFLKKCYINQMFYYYYLLLTVLLPYKTAKNGMACPAFAFLMVYIWNNILFCKIVETQGRATNQRLIRFLKVQVIRRSVKKVYIMLLYAPSWFLMKTCMSFQDKDEDCWPVQQDCGQDHPARQTAGNSPQHTSWWWHSIGCVWISQFVFWDGRRNG